MVKNNYSDDEIKTRPWLAKPAGGKILSAPHIWHACTQKEIKNDCVWCYNFASKDEMVRLGIISLNDFPNFDGDGQQFGDGQILKLDQDAVNVTNTNDASMAVVFTPHFDYDVDENYSLVNADNSEDVTVARIIKRNAANENNLVVRLNDCSGTAFSGDYENYWNKNKKNTIVMKTTTSEDENNCWLNGHKITTLNDGTPSEMTSFFLGALNAGGSWSFDGEIHRLMFFRKYLSDDDAEKLSTKGYL